MSLSASEWARAKSIAMEAIELPVGERSGFVERACSDSGEGGAGAEIRAEVESLLEADIGVRGGVGAAFSSRRIQRCNR